MTGSQKAFDDMIDGMRPSGKIAFLGIPSKPFTFDFSKLIFKMINIKGIYGRNIFDTWRQCENLLMMGVDIEKVLSHELH